MYIMSSSMPQSLQATVRSRGVQPAELSVPRGRAQTQAHEPGQGVVQGCAPEQGCCVVGWKAALWLHPPSSGFACLMGVRRIKC